jgi:hypothetical protein
VGMDVTAQSYREGSSQKSPSLLVRQREPLVNHCMLLAYYKGFSNLIQRGAVRHPQSGWATTSIAFRWIFIMSLSLRGVVSITLLLLFGFYRV